VVVHFNYFFFLLHLEISFLVVESKYWPCLLSLITVQDSAWHYSLHFFSLFHFFQQQFTSKHFHFFHFLYQINNFFFIIQIQNSLKYKKISLFYTNSFYFISHHHFLLILKLTTSLLCSVPVFAKQLIFFFNL
jgi:hypothetical protein